MLSRAIRNISHVRKFSTLPAGSYLPHDDVKQRVLNVVKSFKSAPPEIPDDAHFVVDLKFDSLLRKDLVIKLQKEFCVPALNPDTILSVESATKEFASNPRSR